MTSVIHSNKTYFSNVFDSFSQFPPFLCPRANRESLSCSFLKRDGSNSLSSLSNICYAFFLLHNFCVPFFFLLIFYRQLYYCVSYFLSIFYAHPFFLSPSPPPLLPLSILRFLTTNHIPPPPSPHRKGGGGGSGEQRVMVTSRPGWYLTHVWIL